MKIPNYILETEELKDLDFNSLVSEDILRIAEETSKKNINEYLKDTGNKDAIEKLGIEYFIVIYALLKSGKKDIPSGFKSKLREIIIENNGIDSKTQNLDFYLGSCGIIAQNLALD